MLFKNVESVVVKMGCLDCYDQAGIWSRIEVTSGERVLFNPGAELYPAPQKEAMQANKKGVGCTEIPKRLQLTPCPPEDSTYHIFKPLCFQS